MDGTVEAVVQGPFEPSMRSPRGRAADRKRRTSRRSRSRRSPLRPSHLREETDGLSLRAIIDDLDVLLVEPLGERIEERRGNLHAAAFRKADIAFASALR
jgi:hypothetical protein